MALAPTTLEALPPATATQTANTVELKSEKVSVTFYFATGMIQQVKSRNKEVPFKDGPVAVGIKMRYEPTQSYVRNTSEGGIYCTKHKGASDSIVWYFLSHLHSGRTHRTSEKHNA